MITINILGPVSLLADYVHLTQKLLVGVISIIPYNFFIIYLLAGEEKEEEEEEEGVWEEEGEEEGDEEED